MDNKDVDYELVVCGGIPGVCSGDRRPQRSEGRSARESANSRGMAAAWLSYPYMERPPFGTIEWLVKEASWKR